MRAELEQRMAAKVVTYEDRGRVLPGGMCGCCGGGPKVEPGSREEPWYVYRAGMCDADGVYYSMLCEGCLEDMRAENDRRPLTERDEVANQITQLLGDDIDGAKPPWTTCFSDAAPDPRRGVRSNGQIRLFLDRRHPAHATRMAPDALIDRILEPVSAPSRASQGRVYVQYGRGVEDTPPTPSAGPALHEYDDR